jgi:hypothetical protein
MGNSERDRQVIEKSERQASDGKGERDRRQMMGKSERQANNGEERERQAK